ncbi:UDP-glucosyltransferase 2-like [Culex pipiens pallens]|uniref:UDP-glucosyltransferase 2-like n=1 Tax=Culex pipiens pallens TaxID=42434 RepID=UPI001952CF9C|nr:UDP-glucosyltransferase 2-like [Culex pipiens pallens]
MGTATLRVVSLIATVFVLMAFVVENGSGSRILAIFPSPAKSHQIVFRAIVKGLLERGHHVTMMSTDPIETDNPNITQIDWSFAHKIIVENIDVAKLRQENCKTLTISKQLLHVTEMFVRAEMNHPDVQQLIRNAGDEQFDVLIVEYFQMTPFFAFAELFNVPMIGVTSIDSISQAHEVVGNVVNPVIHPEISHKFSVNLNFFQRIDALLTFGRSR